ncbi:PD-(D/E)XK nuclease family protein [Paenibacillus lemnae]|uniref:PD-(D/E)XK nuclease family protein n=1 Tax=Paenibacillus lemnae TaxID=1330551 RepID=A0A848M343_PAELE|nr:PD-(D/E)XK nuclease family protein [Paenibacillus lemnae]NMO94986.1 PD-(D/E)XK nuclease family protein [Paenibacillus lemnae]
MSDMDELYHKINRFVTNNDLLELLNSRINEFNPFKVMKVDQFEIRHSNILAWLLNPRENHFLSDLVLKKVTAEVICRDIDIKNHDLKVSDILLGSFHILVFSRSNDFILLIENKVHAGLESHQLEKYIQLVKDHYPGVQHIIPVFLTLNGEEAPHSEYFSLAHLDILSILKSILTLNKENMNSKIHNFISYYTKTLEVLTLQDEQLIKLCRDIYKHHREAIETIIKYGVTSTSTLNQAAEVLKSELNDIGHGENPDFFLSDKEYWFMPNMIDQQLPRLLKKWKSPRPISYFFAAEEKKLRLILEVGPITDGHTRLKLLNYINDNDPDHLLSIKSNALKKLNGSFTRIRAKSVDISDWTDADLVVERMNYLLEKGFKYNEVNHYLGTLLQQFSLGNSSDTI